MELTYTAVKAGIYIQDIYGNLYTEDEWDGTQTANGIAVIAEQCEFVIGLEHYDGVYYGGYGTTVNGIVTTEDRNTALADYAGESNTEKIIDALGEGNAPAAEYCAAYTFPNGQKGYLGAAGEWGVILDNNSAIESALKVCDGGENELGTYWTSTQYNSNEVWKASTVNTIIYGSSKEGETDSARPFAPYIAQWDMQSTELVLGIGVGTDGPESVTGVGSYSLTIRSGITWREFCGSAYNKSGFYVQDDYVCIFNGYIKGVSPDAVISSIPTLNYQLFKI